MTKEEAIKYLQQLYPNGGHCWLDEQRIEAIGMAVKALQEEPVSEGLKTELNKYIKDHFTIDTEQLDRFGIEEKDYMYSMDKSDMLALVENFTNWQKTKEEPVSEDFDALDQLLAKYAIDFSYKGKTLKECSDRYKAEIIATANHLEPVSKVWHDSNKEQPEYGSDVVILQGYEGDVLHRVVKVNPDRIWAYTNDLLNLTLPNSSEREKEPVSDELEEAADNALNNVLNTHEIINVRSCLEMFRFGAKWQKEQIKEVLLSDVLPCFMHGGEADEVVAKLDEVLNQKK